MEQIVVRRPGSYKRLQCVETGEPHPTEGHALIRTVSIGVNFADVVVRLGLYPSAKEYVGWPITPGFEFSGVVERLGGGRNPDALRVGDHVLGVMRFGAYSSQVVVPYSQLFRVPSGVTLMQAGVIPVANLTAYYALHYLGATQPGDKVLVHSAAGGVGSAMVQMARVFGAYVVGVVGSSSKVDFVRALGADAVIDKSREDLPRRMRDLCPQGYDVVLDANGVGTMRASYDALRPTGRLVVYGAHTMLSRGSGRPNWLKLVWDYLRTPRFDPMEMINHNKSVLGFNLSYLFGEQQLLRDSFSRILGWYSEGVLRVPQVQEYALQDAAQAHQALQTGTTMGKLTLIPAGAPTSGILPEQKDLRLVEGNA